jgi:hypothetical protein
MYGLICNIMMMMAPAQLPISISDAVIMHAFMTP